MVEAEKMEECGLEIVHVHLAFDDVVTQFIGCAVGVAASKSTASHPEAEGARMMVAPQELRAVAFFVHRRAPEFAAPDHQRVIEQTALLQVSDQRRHRAVRLARALLQSGGMNDVRVLADAVGVPTPVVQLHEADAAFEQAARERAIRERNLARFRAVSRGRVGSREISMAQARWIACGKPFQTLMRVLISGRLCPP